MQWLSLTQKVFWLASKAENKAKDCPNFLILLTASSLANWDEKARYFKNVMFKNVKALTLIDFFFSQNKENSRKKF